MKHSKRTAYLLCFSLIISVLFPASACLAETPSPENPAALLHSLGIMQGPNPKAFQPDLTAPATKVTGVVLLARTLGYSAEAQAMSPKEVSGLLRPFKDGDEVPHWAAGYIADAVKRKLINGNNGFLEPNTQLTNQNYYKMLLNALGYEQGADFTWAEVKSFADSKGLGKDTSKKDLTVNDLAAVTVEALKAKPKGSDKTLIEELVSKGIISESVVKDTNLLPQGSAQTVPAVQTVSPIQTSPQQATGSSTSTSSTSTSPAVSGPVVSIMADYITPGSSGTKAVNKIDLSSLGSSLTLLSRNWNNNCSDVITLNDPDINAIHEWLSSHDYLTQFYDITTGSSFILLTSKENQANNPLNISITSGNQTVHSETIVQGQSPKRASLQLVLSKLVNQSGKVTLTVNEQSMSYDITAADTATTAAAKIATFTLDGYIIGAEGNSIFFTANESGDLPIPRVKLR